MICRPYRTIFSLAPYPGSDNPGNDVSSLRDFCEDSCWGFLTWARLIYTRMRDLGEASYLAQPPAPPQRGDSP